MLWDRSPVEDDEAFFWFAAYRDARPPRQLARLRTGVPGKIAPPLQQLMVWYNTYNWRQRASAWDAHLDSIRQAEAEDAAAQSAQDHARIDQALLNEARDLVAREIDKMIRTSLSSESESLRPAEVRHLLDSVVKLGRLVRGESTEKVDVEYDVSGLSDEDLQRLSDLREKIRKT